MSLLRPFRSEPSVPEFLLCILFDLELPSTKALDAPNLGSISYSERPFIAQFDAVVLLPIDSNLSLGVCRRDRRSSMAVAKTVEIISSSTESVEAAVRDGIAKAAETIQGIQEA